MKLVPSTKALKNCIRPLHGVDSSSTPFSKMLPGQTMLSRGRLSTKTLPCQTMLARGRLSTKTLPCQTMLARGHLSTKTLPYQTMLSRGHLFSNTAVPDAHASSFDPLGCCQEMGVATLSVESIVMHLHVHPVTGQSPCSLKEKGKIIIIVSVLE